MDHDLRISSASITDRGLSEKRPQNEDSYLEMPERGIFAVADGVGGAQAGEVASQMAMELLSEAFANLSAGNDAETAMRAAFGQANSAIYQMAQELSQLANMATTVVALHLNGNVATIGHVGDSRLYRIDPAGELRRETQDHSMVAEEVRAGRMTEEQAENHPSRNIISRALGADSAVEADLRTIMFEPGSTFLLCSDGITRHITDAEIKAVLNHGQPAEICQYFRDLCYERGAEDNLTAVIVRVEGEPAGLSEPVYESAGEEDTIATARPTFGSPAFDEDDLLEIDTAELPAADSLTQGVNTDIEEIVSPAEANEPAEVPGGNEPAEAATDNFTMFGNSGDEPAETGGSGGLGSIAVALAMLVIGGLAGFGVYHFAIARNTAPPAPQISEMSSQNIPLSTFEKNRRNVDSDPAGYIKSVPVDPQDCEDTYLLGRAYLLTGDYPKARASFAAARKLLPGADPANAKTLAAEIAFGLAVTNDTTIQGILKNELDASSRPANTNANR